MNGMSKQSSLIRSRRGAHIIEWLAVAGVVATFSAMAVGQVSNIINNVGGVIQAQVRGD